MDKVAVDALGPPQSGHRFTVEPAANGWVVAVCYCGWSAAAPDRTMALGYARQHTEAVIRAKLGRIRL